jgi:hypothetical protein
MWERERDIKELMPFLECIGHLLSVHRDEFLYNFLSQGGKTAFNSFLPKPLKSGRFRQEFHQVI